MKNAGPENDGKIYSSAGKPQNRAKNRWEKQYQLRHTTNYLFILFILFIYSVIAT